MDNYLWNNFLWEKLGIRAQSPPIIRCDNCGQKISVAGIKPKMKERGEHQVHYFSCVHCGKDYQITTTDDFQRRGIERRRRLGARIRLAYGRKFRQETVDAWHRDYDELGKALNRRASWLRAIGEEILSGKEITTRKDDGERETGGGDSDGPADGQGGAGGLQAD